jgi:hypothetical protein
MGLDGYVACDCIEKGKAQVPPAIASFVKIARDSGSCYLDSLDKRHRQVYSLWRASKPCPHDGGILLAQRLGSAAGIEEFRKALAERVQSPNKDLRLLWTKVVYSGVHSGDSLTVEQVARLQTELQVAQPLFEKDPVFLRFLKHLGDLVAAALKVGKPLGF